MIRFDSHVHTRFSDGTIFYNGIGDLKRLVKKYNFNTFAVTDHNTTRGLDYVGRACKKLGLIFIPGIEISTKQGHIAAYGVYEWDHKAYTLDLMDTLERLQDLNAVIVPVHPFDGRMGIGSRIFDAAVRKRIDGFEVFNGASPWQNMRCTVKAKNLVSTHAMFSGSDCHSPVMFYRYHTEVDCNSSRLDDILECMRDKYKVKPVGPLLDLFRWMGDYIPAEIGRKRLKRGKKTGQS
ncbi:MAG: PHP domain-containing protein [Promethearchaeota archaeon]